MVRISGFVLIGSLLLAGSAVAQTAVGGETRSYDKKHVEALFQAQDASGETLTRDQIAAYRSESGWGKAFKAMQADGYYEGYKNFGQVISSSKIAKADRIKIDKPHKAQKLRRVTRVNRPNRPKRPRRPRRR